MIAKEIPVIDIEPLTRPDADPASLDAVVARIAAACRDWGFFQVVGHGATPDLIDRVWAESRRFFALPRETKHGVARTAENPRGYYDRELTKNVRDLKEVFDFGYVLDPTRPDDDPANRAPVDGNNQWPTGSPEFRTTMKEYFAVCERMGRQIFEGFCLGLGLPRDHLHDAFDGHTSFVRLNYYPLEDPLDAAQASAVKELGDMALQHHTDSGALTILLQDDVGGLQVEASGEWVDVAPTDGALVINIGDMTQVWSNDRYRAALHRVRPMRTRARHSVPFFYNPSYATDCAPLPFGSDPPKYRPINWGEFRRARTAGDYADYGEEIQISHFLVEASGA